jgi:hypothetical protein
MDMFEKRRMTFSLFAFHHVRHAQEFGTDLQTGLPGRRQIHLKPDLLIAPRQIDNAAAG